MRRMLGLGCLVLAAVMYASLAHAEYPERSVRIVVPVAAGGGVDVMARLIAQALSERWNQQFVVENRPGAAGIIGTKSVIASPPDGYTLLYTPSSLALAVVVHEPAPYDIARDLTPVINVAVSPYALALHKGVPATSVSDVVVYARAHPNALAYGSAGIGSASHLAAELFKSMAGIEMVHVPNKGMNPAVVDLLGGAVQVLFASIPALQVEHADRVRVIAVAESKRSGLIPALPTIAETGMPGFAVGNWAGLLGPAAMDARIVTKLHDGIEAILDTAEMRARVQALGYDLIASTPGEFTAQLTADIVRWSDVVKRAKIPLN